MILIQNVFNLLAALVVQDGTQAGVSAQRYPYQQMPGYSPLFPDNLLEVYREYRYCYGAAEELVVAIMLGKNRTGFVLLRGGSNRDCKVINVKVKRVGEELAFALENCP